MYIMLLVFTLFGSENIFAVGYLANQFVCKSVTVVIGRTYEKSEILGDSIVGTQPVQKLINEGTAFAGTGCNGLAAGGSDTVPYSAGSVMHLRDSAAITDFIGVGVASLTARYSCIVS